MVIIKAIYNHRNRAIKILVKPNRKLTQICEPIDFATTMMPEILEILRKLNATINNQNWGDRLGLAAPQIGITKRVFIYLSRGTYKVCINPTWSGSKAPKSLMVEACYSLRKGDMYRVERDSYGWAHYQGINGKWEEEKLNGMDAIVYQHELSHLDGKCCDVLGTLIERKKK